MRVGKDKVAARPFPPAHGDNGPPPARLEDVTDEMVAAFFAPLGDGELGLADRAYKDQSAGKGRKAQ